MQSLVDPIHRGFFQLLMISYRITVALSSSRVATLHDTDEALSKYFAKSWSFRSSRKEVSYLEVLRNFLRKIKLCN